MGCIIWADYIGYKGVIVLRRPTTHWSTSQNVFKALTL